MSLVGINKQDLDRLLETQAVNGNVFDEGDIYIVDGQFHEYNLDLNVLERIEPLGEFPVRWWSPNAFRFRASRILTPPIADYGWASYEDTQYTDASPWVPDTDVWTDVPNNAGVVVEQFLPREIEPGFWYDSAIQKLSGKTGDGMAITLQLVIRPTTGASALTEVGLFVGEGAGPLGDGRVWQRTITTPRGQGVPHVNLTSIVVGVGPIGGANGARVQIYPSNPIEVFGIEYHLSRFYQSRIP